MIKLVALDLDGTIVNDRLEVSPRTLKLLNHLITQTDVKVVIATGRMFLSALPFAKTIGVKEPLIAYQGAMIKSLDEHYTMRYHQPIPLATARNLMEFLIGESFQVNLYLGDALWTTPQNEHSTFYAKAAGVIPQFTPDLLGILNEAPSKIMVIDDHRVDELMQILNQKFHGHLTYCRSRSNFCEMIDVSCSKWNALQQLMKEWDILPEEVMCIGDQGNDISMLTGAGVGVAMGNAPDDVKAIANYVTDPIDKDGAAKAIEKFVLGDMPFAERPAVKPASLKR